MSDFDQRMHIMGAAMMLRDLYAQIDGIKEKHPQAEALAELMASKNGSKGHYLSDDVRDFLAGSSQLQEPSDAPRKTRKKKTRITRADIEARLDAIRRPSEPDASFPRIRGPLTLNNLERFEERVKAYWDAK